MPFQLINLAELYERDSQLKREDIEALQEWITKQPHLLAAQISEEQLLLFLHACYYKMEPTKLAIDNYFTMKTQCSELLDSLNFDLLESTLSVGFLNILPKKTPEGYVVMLMKLLDCKADNFSWTNQIRAINMIGMLYMHLYGYQNGVVAVFDMKGFTLGHLARINLMVLRKGLYHLQEGAPLRLKSVHFINVVPFIDKVIGIAKPFIKPELYKLLNFHTTSIESFYEYVPKKCLPKDYGGDAACVDSLNENCIRNVKENFDFFKWHDAQKVDESKRLDKSSNIYNIFGMEGSFKKLDID